MCRTVAGLNLTAVSSWQVSQKKLSSIKQMLPNFSFFPPETYLSSNWADFRRPLENRTGRRTTADRPPPAPTGSLWTSTDWPFPRRGAWRNLPRPPRLRRSTTMRKTWQRSPPRCRNCPRADPIRVDSVCGAAVCFAEALLWGRKTAKLVDLAT